MNIFKLTLFLFLKFFYIFNIKMFTRSILIMRLCSIFLYIVKPFCVFCYSFKKFFSFPMGKNSCKYCINFYIRPLHIIYIGHIRSNGIVSDFYMHKNIRVIINVTHDQYIIFKLSQFNTILKILP